MTYDDYVNGIAAFKARVAGKASTDWVVTDLFMVTLSVTCHDETAIISAPYPIDDTYRLWCASCNQDIPTAYVVLDDGNQSVSVWSNPK